MGANHNSKDFRVKRAVVIWLADYKCEVCKVKSDSLHVHHVNRLNYDNRLENLQPLCPQCHAFVEKTSMFGFRTSRTIAFLIFAKFLKFLGEKE